MKKAFTLIELLAVIIILAVVALVATPIILDVIEDARNSANKETVHGLIKAGEYYYAESLLNEDKKQEMDGKTDIYNKIVVSGEKPEIGNLYVNEQGKVAILVVLKDKCYKKNFYGELEELDKDNEECKASNIINDDVAPEVTLKIEGIEGNNGWYKEESVYVNISVSDKGSGLSSYKWCATNLEDCEPINEEVSSTSKEILNGYKMCVIAKDKTGNESELKCTDYLKIDTEKPTIKGVADLIVQVGGEVDLNSGIEVEDLISGIDGTYEVIPNSIDTNEAKVVEVEYKVKDKAGNENTKTRKIIISESPSVEYITEDGKVNEEGYAKEDFYVTINVIDNSGQGIKEIKLCAATTDRCEPEDGSVITDTTAVRAITQEGDNRICVKATDNYGHTSETICSDIYKLDKTLPTVSYSLSSGTYNELKTIRITPNDTNYDYMSVEVYKDGWESSKYIKEKSKSNIADLYYDIELDSDGVGTVLKKVYDKAGNKQEQTPNNGTGEDGWYYRIYTIDIEITLLKSLDTDNKYFVLKPSLEIDGATYTWYKDNSVVSNNKEYTVTSTGTYKLNVTKDSFSKTTSDFVVNGYQIKNDRVLYAAKENDNCVLRRNGSNEIEEFVYSNKCTITTALNMVKNGYLEYKDNTNFPGFTYDANEDALYRSDRVNFRTEELIPIDYNKKYNQSLEMKSSNASYRHYAGIEELDVDLNSIDGHNVMYKSKTTSFLTKDLNDGDTVVYLNNVSNFVVSSSTPSYQLGLIFWNYKDSTGFEYPEFTYSRNAYENLFTYTNVNITNNTITLNSPWKFGTFKVGTSLSQSNDGGTYSYGLFAGSSVPNVFTKYTNSVTGWDTNRQDTNENYLKFRYGTRYIKFILLHNYDNSTPNTSYIKNIVITEE